MVLDEKKDKHKQMIKARKENIDAYNGLILLCIGKVGFGIVEGTVTESLSEGDTKLVWIRLKKKYEQTSRKNKVESKKNLIPVG